MEVRISGETVTVNQRYIPEYWYGLEAIYEASEEEGGDDDGDM